MGSAPLASPPPQTPTQGLDAKKQSKTAFCARQSVAYSYVLNSKLMEQQKGPGRYHHGPGFSCAEGGRSERLKILFL